MMEQTLPGAEAWMADLAAMAEDMLCVVGADGYFRYVNPACERTLGYSRKELLARPIIEFFHPEDRALAVSLLEPTASAPMRRCQLRCVCKDGGYKVLWWTLRPRGGRVFATGREVRPVITAQGTPPELEVAESAAIDALSDMAGALSQVADELAALAAGLTAPSRAEAPTTPGADVAYARAEIERSLSRLRALASSLDDLGPLEPAAPTPDASADMPGVTEDVDARSRTRVLVVDDDHAVARSLVRVLSRRYDVQVARHGAQALALLAEESFDAILCDIVMPVMDGVAFFQALQERQPELAKRVAFVTGGALTVETATFLDKTTNLRADKPCPPDQLLALVEEILARQHQ